LDLLRRHGEGRRVVIVGHFPFVDSLRQAVGKLWVLERRPRAGDQPADLALELIPRADVVAITGATLVNRTFDDLLALCRVDAFVVVLGPSTPLWPGLFDFGVSALAGADVVDEGAALQAIGQAASFRDLPGVSRVVLRAGSSPPRTGP
jgi:uncharacterized protein (DUF4213/DUF364 family)